MQPSLPPSPTPRSSRRVGLHRPRVDAFRVYAMLWIIVAHSELAIGFSGQPTLQVLALSILVRAAVPLFFILAGEHLGPRLLRDRAPGTGPRYMRRLATLFVGASLLYWLLDLAKLARRQGLGSAVGTLLAQASQDPVQLLFSGARMHLWFLMALMIVVAAATLVLARSRVRIFVLVSAVLYGVGLAIGPYAGPLGIDPARNWFVWLLQSPLFFALGVFFGLEQEHLPRRSTAVALVVAGLAVHTAEVLYLTSAYNAAPFRLAMLLGTVPYAAGVGLFAFEPRASRMDRWAARFGGYVPTVYLIHMVFIEILKPPRGRFPDLAVRVVLALLTIVLSFGTAAYLGRLLARGRRKRRMRVRASLAMP